MQITIDLKSELESGKFDGIKQLTRSKVEAVIGVVKQYLADLPVSLVWY